MMYFILAINEHGVVRYLATNETIIPDNFAQPGETAILVQVLAVQGRHAHEMPGGG